MKFRCERDELVEALGTAGRAVANRGGALPVLSGVRLELDGDALRLTGSDLDLTISVSAEVAGEVDGVAVMPAKIASDVVRSLDPGRVEISVDGDEAQITSGRFSSSIRLLPADEFPRLATPADDAVTLDGADLASALSQVVPAASSDDARPILTGVLMAAEGGGLRLVATDSYRLAVRDLEGRAVLAEGQSVLVPSRALRELVRALDDGEVTLRLGEREATFEVGSTRVTTRLIEGEFPNYRGLIPSTYPNRMVIGREALGDAVRPRAADGPRGHTGAAHHEHHRARPRRRHPGRGPGQRDGRRHLRGHRAHGGVQPGVPPRRHRGRPRRLGHPRDHRRQQAGRPAGRGSQRLPVPAHAGAHLTPVTVPVRRGPRS